MGGPRIRPQSVELDNGTRILDTTSDPSSGGGLAAPVGSIALQTDGAVWRKTGSGDTDWASLVSGGGGGGVGGLIGCQVITATGAGTYTPTTGTGSIVIEMVGGGGGGGGVPQPGGTSVAFGRGGGGGAYLRKRLTANFSGASYSVGAKGAGGSAGSNAGSSGGDTTFTATGGGGTVYTAGGGPGGNAGSAATAPTVGLFMAGGTATNGDINIPGGQGRNGMAVTSTMVIGGAGGDSWFAKQQGAAIANGANASSAGAASTGKGCGGGGAAANGTGSAAAGADGTDGMLIIWEYAAAVEEET